ncbi:MAG: 16S rRNA (guanine(966)-N(2))-methyltransferase RsmD [Rhodospirillales bacterium]|nr:16S rRNA (guanine(966)-N(2))-methyltransferase RsmD [Rhodospirillales bacterium]
MRIVAGRHRGRRLLAPEGLAVRPTSDRTREALFNILASGRGVPALEGAQLLDAFAGTGALGLEALSRGAARVTFMESLPAALATLRRNIGLLGEEECGRVLQADVLRPPPAKDGPVRIVLMDPPYGQGLAAPAIAALAAAGWIGPETLIVVELMAGEAFAPPQGFAIRDERKYGKARLVFLGRG